MEKALERLVSKKLENARSLLHQIKIVHETWQEHEHKFKSFSQLASEMTGILLSVEKEFSINQSSDMVRLLMCYFVFECCD